MASTLTAVSLKLPIVWTLTINVDYVCVFKCIGMSVTTWKSYERKRIPARRRRDEQRDIIQQTIQLNEMASDKTVCPRLDNLTCGAPSRIVTRYDPGDSQASEVDPELVVVVLKRNNGPLLDIRVNKFSGDLW